MDNKIKNKIFEINESTKKFSILELKFYNDRDFYLAYPMSHTARGYINDLIRLCSRHSKTDIINKINVPLIEVLCGIYLLDSCGTKYSPLNKALKANLDYLVTDEPQKAFSNQSQMMLNFSERKVCSDVIAHLEDFSECYEYLRKNVLSFDFRHSELRSIFDAFSNRYSEYWKSYIEHLIKEKKLLKGSTPIHIFWGYNQFVVPYDKKVKNQKESFSKSKELLISRSNSKETFSIQEMREESRKAKVKIRKKLEERRDSLNLRFKNLFEELNSISERHPEDEQKNKVAYDWVNKYVEYLIEAYEMSYSEAEELAIDTMEKRVYYKS